MPAPTTSAPARPDRRGRDGRQERAEALLEVRDLGVEFRRRGAEPVRAVDGVSLSVRPGEVMGLVGESGSGKSVTSLAVMGLLPRRSSRVTGSVRLAGSELVGMPGKRLAALRGAQMSMVFQDPMSSLNPVVPIGTQVTEVLRTHTGADRGAARDEAEDLLRRVGIPDPRRRLRDYPHQLSGGMRQRALIAIALACKPRLLIADEPTTALDVTIQAQVLELLRVLVADTGTAMLLITHDLGVVAGLCDDVTVMYAGRVVETAPRRELFGAPAHRYTEGLLAAVPPPDAPPGAPAHRYTEGLLASVPRLDAPRGEPLRPIPGTPRDTLPWSRACAFAPRCPHADVACADPDLALAEPAALPAGHAVRCVHPALPAAAGVGA